MGDLPYQRVLFVGPGLGKGSMGEAFVRELSRLSGSTSATDIVDTLDGFESLWSTLRQRLDAGVERLLVVDLEPTSDGAYLDWLRDELGHIARDCPGGPMIRVTATALGRRGLDARAAWASIEQPEQHLSCDQVNPVATDPGWSTIAPHARQLFLCTGPRCVRRGALPLWKALRRELLAHDLIEKPGGVLLTRTACQFPCNLGPVLTVHPDGCWYRVASPGDARRLVDGHLLGNRPVSDLLLKGPAHG